MQITSSALSEVVGLKGRSEAMDRTTKPGHCPSKQENRTEESGSNCARAGIKKHARCGGRRRQATSSRTCSVCGDTAFAHNFGVLTCETCKAFFRRNAMKEDSLQCVFDGNCSIDVRSRRLCSACRLKKCLDMGMKRQLILDEDRKKARRLRRMGMNSQKEQMSASGQLLPATPEEACPIIPDHHHVTPSCHAIIPGHFSDQMQSSTSTFIEEFFKQALQDTQQGEDDISLLRVSLTLENPSISSFLSSSAVDAHVSSTPDLQPEELQQQVHEVTATTSPVASSSYPAGVFRGWTHEFRHVPREQLPSDMKQYWMLTREERSLLTHLATAYQDATMNRAPHDGAGRYDNDDGDYISLEVCMQLLERLLHRGVQFAKAVPEFQKLPREVQIGSLKSSAHCATIIDLSATYIIERRIWATELGEFLIDHLCKGREVRVATLDVPPPLPPPLPRMHVQPLPMPAPLDRDHGMPRPTPYMGQPDYRIHELNKRLQQRNEESDNLWWDAFATEFFEDDASLTLTFCLEDGPKRYTIARTLIPRYFRSIFEGGVTDLYYVLKYPKESFHNTTITLDCEQALMVTQHGKPMFPNVITEGRLILEFTFDDLMRIRSWHFAIRQHRELIPRSVIALQQDPAMIEQLSKNITRQGLTNYTLNFLRLCVILEPMQELMSRHKAYGLNPRDCLKTTLFQKWQRMVAPPGKESTRPPSKRRKRKASTSNNSNTGNANNRDVPPSGKQKRSPGPPGFSIGSSVPGDVMVVGEPTLMGGEFGDEDERLITRLENNQYEPGGPGHGEDEGGEQKFSTSPAWGGGQGDKKTPPSAVSSAPPPTSVASEPEIKTE
ncbi:hypothetical protein C0Q70_08878 [Pomacea canaliculata]|uniref:Uncharacterized protein n=2 Tax=Pomacea canaliculata TaxID=400727 RepID=A0A2T7P894_POMCA|nr:hypothetical protein C0Q70_08878 [Pomacea canaliculata]